MNAPRLSLPIDAALPEIVETLERTPNLVLVAEPGAGKTTRVPAALLEARFLSRGQVLVLEPRRLAARMSAVRVASELGENVGQRVGYMVRFERVVSDQTRVIFLTEALLTRRLVDDPTLSRVSCVVLDEFHERSLHTDLGLALLRRLQRTTRPDLRIIVMSATLDAERLADFLDAPTLRVPGRTFPVHVEYLERPDERRLEEQVQAAARKLLVRSGRAAGQAGAGRDGDVLVFLPGAAEIRRAEESCSELAKTFGLEIATLHGDLPASEQDRAVRRGSQPKLVLSTNIAETSLTLEGVSAVIDSGLARVAGHSPWSGLPTLGTAKVSQASAIQRAGRAGRVREGSCLRLYTKSDFDGRPRFDAPDISKSDLTETELTLHALLAGESDELAWLDSPPRAARDAARDLLARLGALAPGGALSELGRTLLRMPVHPRLSRLAIAMAERGYPHEGASLAALVAEREIRIAQRTSFSRGGRRHDEVGESDVLARFEAFDALGDDHSAQNARRHELDAQAVRSVARMRDQLAQRLRAVERSIEEPFEQAVRVATLLAFGDRVAKRRHPSKPDVVLSGGGSASLAEGSVVKEAEFLVAVEADERGRGGASVRTASAIEPEWLLEYFPERVREERKASFDARNERVEVSVAMLYDGLTLDESRRAAEPSPDASLALAEAALARGAAAPWDVDAVESLQRRTRFAHTYDPSIPVIDEDLLKVKLVQHCADKNSFADLRADPFEHALPQLVSDSLRARLERLAPARVRLPSGRELVIHYEIDRPPWVESRLQDFFGMLDGPRLANGQVPLVLHLLAPNQRPVQVSTDLKGFWDRHYAQIRKELMRRYPRHSWPEDPRTAEPPQRKPRP
ncbi:MAG: ATP-dependent helicase HrpB [Myxococcales bacterium]